MKYLLDTHSFIWLDNEPSKLTSRVSDICANVDNTLWLSVVSVWEMQIKLQLGKLKLRLPLTELIDSQQQLNAIELLPLNALHVFGLARLPDVHKDPFDRIWVAQAVVESLILITDDPIMTRYPIDVVW